MLRHHRAEGRRAGDGLSAAVMLLRLEGRHGRRKSLP